MNQQSVLLLILLISIFSCEICALKAKKSSSPALTDFASENITSNLADWEQDQAIMFYAPWCKYCKQLLPSWEAVARLMKSGQGSLLVGKFNCEQSANNRELCVSLQIDHYPSIYYIGYGNFHQRSVKKNSLSQDKYANANNIVRYNAALYPEALYDWVQMLSSLSSFHRKWEDFTSIFTGKSSHSRKLAAMQVRLSKAEKKANLFGTELERYKAFELFDQLKDEGDIFPLLHELEPDEQNLPLRVCVADLASEYCKYNMETDQFCQRLDQCSAEQMEPLVCRPAKCPFEDSRGCRVTSACMRTDVIEEYKKALK